jgi:hypothetical protein
VRLALASFALVLAIVAFILALYAVSLTMALPASAHCFSVWRYPWPQRCGGSAYHPITHRLIATRSHLRFRSEAPFASEPALPLPSLARADLDEPEADEPTRAHVLLRAALEEDSQ